MALTFSSPRFTSLNPALDYRQRCTYRVISLLLWADQRPPEAGVALRRRGGDVDHELWQGSCASSPLPPVSSIASSTSLRGRLAAGSKAEIAPKRRAKLGSQTGSQP